MDKEALEISEITHHYSVLGVPLTATKDELRRARNRLLHHFHPDRNPKGWTYGEDTKDKRAYLIQSAYLYVIENYDEIQKSLGFLTQASLTNRMPLKTRTHWIYTTVASYDDNESE